MRLNTPLPPLLPDKIEAAGVLTKAANLLPAEDGYFAVRGFESVSDPLPAEFRGAASFISTDGTAYLIAGTSNGLARLSAGAWSNLRVGLSIPARWRFTQFGQFVIAVSGTATQEVDLNAGTASDLTGAPTGTDVTVVGENHVVYAQPNGDKLRVRWSAFGDHTGNTLGTNQAGDQPMLTGGEVMGLAGGEYGVILQRQRLVRMSLTGDADAPFQFDQITDNYGCASKASIAQAGRTVFFLSDRGFMGLDDGQAIRPIGDEKFNRDFLSQVPADEFERIWAVVDPTLPIVYWALPGSPGKVWAYNFDLDRLGDISLPFNGVFPGFENSQNMEEIAATYPDLDAMPFSLDDPRFAGGSPRVYFVDSAREIGTLTGRNLVSSFTHSQFAPAKEKQLRFQGIWPDTDATSGITVKVDARQRRGDPEAVRTATGPQASGKIPIYHRGRFISVTGEIDNADWSYIAGYEIQATLGGER